MSEQAKNSAPQDNKSNPIGALEQDVKILSAIGYIGLLFLAPYLVKPKDKFAVFHANQGLLLLIATVVVLAGVLLTDAYTDSVQDQYLRDHNRPTLDEYFDALEQQKQ